MIEFIDKTSEQDGTSINRENLMAIQGFVGTSIVFNANGSIIETNAKGEKLTTTFPNKSTIKEVFVGEKTLTKTTKISGDGTKITVEVKDS